MYCEEGRTKTGALRIPVSKGRAEEGSTLLWLEYLRLPQVHTLNSNPQR